MENRHTTLRNIGKNLISLATSQLVNRLMGTAILLILPRYLGPGDYGIYLLAIAYIEIFSIFAGYGLDGLFIKDVSRDRGLSQHYFCTNIVIKESLAFLCIVVLILIMYFLDYSGKTVSATLIMSLTVFIRPFMSTYSAVFRSYEKMEYNAAIEISASLLRLLGVIAVIKLGGDIIWIVSVYVINSFVLALIGFILINNKFFRIVWAADWRSVTDSFKKSTPFFLVSAIAVIQDRLAILMLSKLGSNADIGFFGAASELINILYIIPNLTATVLFPVYSRQYSTSSQSLISGGNLSLKYMAIIGFPISAGIYFVAPQVINLIYGGSFSGSIVILQILGLGVWMLFIANTVAYVLTASDRIKYVTVGNTITVVFGIGLNFLLIPLWGGAGAALTVLLSATFSMVYFYLVVRSEFAGVMGLNGFLKPLLATLSMYTVIWWLEADLIITIIMGVVTYVVAILTLRTIKYDEVQIIKQMIPFANKQL